MEQSRADLVPSGSLLFPVGVACLFWYRSGIGIVIAGAAFMVHWLLHQTLAPLDGAAMLLLTAAMLTHSRAWSRSLPVASRSVRYAWWLQPVLVVLVGSLVHVFLTAAANRSEMTDLLWQRVGVAIFVIAVLTVATRIADELGFRRRSEAF